MAHKKVDYEISWRICSVFGALLVGQLKVPNNKSINNEKFDRLKTKKEINKTKGMQ